MSNPSGNEDSRAESKATGECSQTPSSAAPATAAPEALKKLTPEEQMELYEKDLKENDWGHQPC
jgi:hypothetical protein